MRFPLKRLGSVCAVAESMKCWARSRGLSGGCGSHQRAHRCGGRWGAQISEWAGCSGWENPWGRHPPGGL